MNKTEHLLITLMEECAEVQKSCSKILRFGADDDNLLSLNLEINDIMGVLNLLNREGVVDIPNTELIEKKEYKVLKFMTSAQPIQDELLLRDDFKKSIELLKRLDNHLKIEDGLELDPGDKVKSYPNKNMKKQIRKFIKDHE